MSHDPIPQTPLLDGLDSALLDKYLLGTCTPEELAWIETWIVQNPARRAGLQGLRRGLAMPVAYPTFIATSDLAARVDASLRSKPLATPVEAVQANIATSAPPRSIYRSMWYTFGTMAVVLSVLASGWRIGSSRIQHVLAGHASTYTTGNGQRATIKLPDGSLALLNVGSRLEVPTDYVTGNRTVKLVGEALFTVTHRSTAPFTVKTRQSHTRVLGTSFVVRDYPTDSATTVAVRDGKVSVGEKILTAGDEAVVRAERALVVRPVTDGVFSFTHDVLTLSDISLAKAIPALNRWYDVSIQLGDPTLATQRVVGVFQAGTIADLASILELTFDIRTVRHGRTLTLYPKQ